MRCGNGHTHGSVAEVRVCYGVPPRGAAGVPEAPRVVMTASPVPSLERARERKMNNVFPFPAELLYGMREGRYAVEYMGAMQFVRISEIKPFKSGKPRAFVGSFKLQTQHSDDLVDRYVVHPNGSYLAYTSMVSVKMVAILKGIYLDPWLANLRYGAELGQCCRCGKSLTDERSRYYGIGPECEGHWPNIIERVNADLGVYAA